MKNNILALLPLVIFSFASSVSAKTVNSSFSLEAWIAQQQVIATERMLANISPTGAAPGIILASPQRQDPDYYFHWIRDSALVIEAVLLLEPPANRLQPFRDFVQLSEKLQKTTTLTGLGEPRFNTDATPYNGDWARPQNDGPALRVLAALEGEEGSGLSDTISRIVETDIAYILTHWDQPNYDLWEEVRGHHFYTRRVQMAALEEALKSFNNDWKFSKAEVAATIEKLRTALESQWSEEKGYFAVTQNRMDGGPNKFTDLDVAVVLSALHAKATVGPLGLSDDRLLSTASKLEEMFAELYPINRTKVSAKDNSVLAPAIGRYSDDVYFGGNPWYLTTAAYAELHYKLASHFKNEKVILVTDQNLGFFQKALKQTKTKLPALQVGTNLGKSATLRKALWQGLRQRGDQFLRRVQAHTPAEGGMAEQFERTHGGPMSARDLTWSYAAFLTAVKARQEAAVF